MTPKLPCARPARLVLEGRYARLEPLAPAHVDGLLAASADASSFGYLFDVPRTGRDDLRAWIAQRMKSEDPLFHAVVDKATGVAGGRQTFMRITPEHGVIEIGNILWGPAIARGRVATEALYLAAKYVFDALGYRRFGFDFEGVFRQHMWVKGANRDAAGRQREKLQAAAARR